MTKTTQIPMIRQFEEMKKKHPDAVLLFRIGDFYECFGEDAVVCSDTLKITLTRRANGNADYVHLAGFPYHALDTYLQKLVRAGKRVCICEQLEDPKTRKVLKKRDDAEHVFPGIPTPSAPKPKLSDKDLSRIYALLTVFNDILNKLYIFEEIRRKTQELRTLAAFIGISPKKAFDECNVDNIVQPSLFD